MGVYFNDILNHFKDAGDDELGKIIRAVAGKSLYQCEDINGILKRSGIAVNSDFSGSDKGLTEEILVNSLILKYGRGISNIKLSNNKALFFAKKKGLDCEQASLENMESWFAEGIGITVSKSEMVSGESEPEAVDDISDEEEDDVYGNWGSDEEYEESVEDVDSTDDSVEDEEVSDDKEDVEDNEDEEDEGEGSSDSELTDEKIKGQYYNKYKGVVDVLISRYTALFASGYEIIKPSGILADNGLLSLSGSSVKVKTNDAIRCMYRTFYSKMDFTISEHRSNTKIADSIYINYRSGNRKLVYFPNKLLEYVFGRKAPTGDNQESLNTYEKHSDAANWSGYCNKEVKKSLFYLVEKSVIGFVTYRSKELEVDYYDDSISDELGDFLEYLKACLSLCILLVDYRIKVDGYKEDPSIFKIRVCDPYDTLGDTDIVSIIIKDAFGGNDGPEPHTPSTRVEEEVLVKEYIHEFNRSSSQARPLFAYKAYLALREQGVEPSWDNLILGMFEDGTILKNGSHGVSLGTNLAHHMVAGSRSGKGVMTLNILAGAIYSNKSIFYLDRKPDMASVFKMMSPNMFVINGGGYDPQYDTFKQFINLDSTVNWNNVPDYVIEAFGEKSKSWGLLGDLFYLRALKLVVGIIFARASLGLNIDEKLGGENGILLVVDETSNFQSAYHSLLSQLPLKVPPLRYKDDLNKLSAGKVNEDSFNDSYNNTNFYALTYLKSLVADLDYLYKKQKAGFNQKEVTRSDIFVIGQSVDYGRFDYKSLNSSLNYSRYKNCAEVGYRGLQGFSFKENRSVLQDLVGFKTNDAFFGANEDSEGDSDRNRYFYSKNEDSPANGKLDKIASNFGYLKSYSESNREVILSNNERKSIEEAGKLKYFKPFLVLNDSIPGGLCVEGMFDRCEGEDKSNVYISRAEVIADNPSDTDPSVLNSAIGIEDYLKLMGITDYKDRLAKSSDIANYVVRECLGYQGDWFEFITDMRPQWCFTIRDVVEGVVDGKKNLLDIRKSKILSEFVEFNPSLFGLENESADITNNEYGSISEFMSEDTPYTPEGVKNVVIGTTPQTVVPEKVEVSEDSPIDDFWTSADFATPVPEAGTARVVNPQQVGEKVNIGQVSDGMRGMGVVNEDVPRQVGEEVNIGQVNDMDVDEPMGYDEVEDNYVPEIKEGYINETVASTPDELIDEYEPDEKEKLLAKIAELEELIRRGLGIQRGVSEEQFMQDMNFGGKKYWNENGDMTGLHMVDDVEVDAFMEYTGTTQDQADLIRLFTERILKEYGGVHAIKSFKVLGGMFIINDWGFNCSIGEMLTASLPYDLRCEINAGNVSRLFDYGQLLRMDTLRELEFDSLTFVYDYVASGMGYGSQVDVGLFFRDLPNLQGISIGGKLFTRDTYIESVGGEDIFYGAKASTRFANASEEILGRTGSKSWEFTKNTFKSKDYCKAVKVLGVGVGATIAGTAVVSRAAIKGGRKATKGLKSLGRSMKDMINETRKY